MAPTDLDSGESVPTKLTISGPDGLDQILDDLIGQWVFKEGSDYHVFVQQSTKCTRRREAWLADPENQVKEDRTDEPWPDALYWLSDYSCWRVGPVSAADPSSELAGCGSAYITPPGGAKRYTDSYDAEGLTFTWEGGSAGEALETETPAAGDAPEEEYLAQKVEDGKTTLKWFSDIGKHLDENDKIAEGREADVIKIFKSWDTNADGKIGQDELRSVLNDLLESDFGSEAIEGMVKAADKDGNGQIDCAEFTSWIFGPGLA
eukprot:TRINITY_DN98168_c0_g1_i1.p1 TRINITY_DN98168_c0_g1~~TRINITY_DN98168_c0_g1_i1.p1  ORF type:complete len:262 (+),score=46.21 TRINITY_DN98168_c0_g1_i1:78-863(+)